MERPTVTLSCPLCGPSRRFVSQAGLRMHMQEKHPWRQSSPSLAAALQNSYDEAMNDEIFLTELTPQDISALARSEPNLLNISPHVLPTRQRRSREKVVTRRPWYDDPEYSGPKTLLETSGALDGDDDEDKTPVDEDNNLGTVVLRRNPKGHRRMEEELKRRDYDISDLNIKLREATLKQREAQENALLLRKEKVQSAYEIKELRDLLHEKEREIVEKDRLDPDPKALSSMSRQYDDYPDGRDVTKPPLEDYMRQLQQRAHDAEREARQLRDALSQSQVLHSTEDSDHESLFQPQYQPQYQSLPRIAPSRPRPQAKLRPSVNEELIEPIQARRYENVPIINPPRENYSDPGTTRDRFKGDSWTEGTQRRRELDPLRGENPQKRHNLSDSGFDSAATSKDAGPIFRWPAVGQTVDSHLKSWSWGRPKGPPSGEGSVVSGTDDDRTTSSFAQRSPLSLPSPDCVDDVQRRCEALFCIFLYLDTRSLARTSRVCREWYHVSHQPALWRRVKISRAYVSSRHLATMTRWCTQVEELVLESVRSPPGKPRKDISSNQKRKANQGILESGLEKLLKTNTNSLKSIKIINCDNLLTEHALWLVSCHCSRLQKIVYLSDCDPVGSEVLWALAKGCPQIHTMVVPPVSPNERPEKFDDRCCFMIAESWSMMQVLCVGGKFITDEGLLAISKCCPKLCHLEIDHGPEITEVVATRLIKVGLRGLEMLDFTFTPVTPKAVAQFNSACPKLRKISVHVGISDYYKNVNDQKHKADYSSLCQLFQTLKQRPGFSEVLELKLDYG